MTALDSHRHKIDRLAEARDDRDDARSYIKLAYIALATDQFASAQHYVAKARQSLDSLALKVRTLKNEAEASHD